MTPQPGLLARLGEAAGRDGLVEHEPVVVDGVPFTATLRPESASALSATLRALGEAGSGAVLRGGASRLELGNPPRGASVLLSTGGLRGVGVFDRSDGVCSVAAGTPLEELRQELADSGWELPLDPPGPASTVGGALAAAASGPRRRGFGADRDAVLGLEVALANGERTRCGGRVVKNVTGYDLNKLYTGSLGSLGVIASAWLRLHPRPEAVRVLVAQAEGLAAACAAGLAAARRASARAVALVVSPGAPDGFELTVELAGVAAAVERDARWLAEAHGARECGPDQLDSLRERQGELGPLRLRLACLPTRLPAALAGLEQAGARLLAYPGVGLVYAGFALADGDEEAARQRLAVGAQAAAEAGGRLLVERAPPWAKRGHDVFGESGAALALSAALKARFDPQGTLNPGRFAGFL